MNLKKLEKKPIDKNIEFTASQKVAVDGIIDFIAKPFDANRFVISLVGSAGTGKTFVIKYIIKHCIYPTNVITCASSTHKACRVFSESLDGFEVSTIQSVFGLRLNLNLKDFDYKNPQFAPKGKVKLNNVKLLIIDEASMIPNSLVAFIYNYCCKNQIKVIFIGDDKQLIAVNEMSMEAFNKSNKLYRLTDIVRQELDNPAIQLFEIMRNDINNNTNNSISYIVRNRDKEFYNDNGDGFEVVNHEKFKYLVKEYFNDEDYKENIDKYRLVAYTNNRVNAWNNYIRSIIIPNNKDQILTRHDLVMSYSNIVDEFLSPVISNSEEYIINDISDFVDTRYNFKGYLVSFKSVHGGFKTKPIFIINHTDRFTLVKYTQTAMSLVNIAKNTKLASNWEKYYDFKNKYLCIADIKDTLGNILINRDIDYGFAITSHKSQGSTYENVFVDLNDMLFDKNGLPYSNIQELLRRIYVACSRAKHKIIICYGR